MKVGFSFNYWMVVAPMLYVLGLGISFLLILPGKEKAWKRPFHWQSDVPVAITVLFYSLVSGITFAVMLYLESRRGITELLGRDTFEAFVLTPLVILACGVAMFFATLYGMREMRCWHAAKLKRAWTKRRAQAVIDIARAEATKDEHAKAGLGMVVQHGKNCEIIMFNPNRRRRRKKLFQVWNNCKARLKGMVRHIQTKSDPMVIPERAMRQYR